MNVILDVARRLCRQAYQQIVHGTICVGPPLGVVVPYQANTMPYVAQTMKLDFHNFRRAVIAESATAFVLSRELLEKFGSDNLQDIKSSYKGYLRRIA